MSAYPKALCSMLLTGCLFGISQAHAGLGPHDVIRVCIASKPYPPLTHPEVETPIQARIRKAAESQGFAIEFLPLPWRRCVHDVSADVLDGVVGVGDRVAQDQALAFPIKDAQLDRRRILSDVRFRFFRRVGDPVDWDGRHFHGLDGPVLMIGMVGEIRLDLQLTGVVIADSATGPQELARMLLANRGNLAVDSQERIQLVMGDPEFAGRLEMLDIPLGGRSTLLAFAPHLYRQYPQRIEALWDEYARLMEAEEVAGKVVLQP